MPDSTFCLRTLGGLLIAVGASVSSLWGIQQVPGAAGPPPVVGVVRDSSGTGLPNVRIVVPEANRATTTAAAGNFTFRSLPPGTYHLDASLIGHAPGHATVIVPESGAPVEVEIVMGLSPLALEGVNVTASPTGADPLGITQSTVQLSGKELDRNLGTSVAQTLADEPGMSVRYAGPAAAAPVIRGLTGERILVLQNGQRTGDLSSSSPDHGVSLDPLAATQIEVVRGPASLLYGNSALGGVVNVLSADIPTTIPNHWEGYLAGQGESVNPGGALTGELTAPLGSSLAVNFRAGGRSVDDVRVGGGGLLDNSYYRNLYGSAGLGYVGNRNSGGVAVERYGFDYGLPAPEDAEESGVHLEGHREEVKARGRARLGAAFFSNVEADATAQWYTHDEIEDDGEIGTTFNLRTQTLELTSGTTLGTLEGAIGISGLFKQYQATGEEALTPPADSRSGGVFVFQEIPLGSVMADADNAPRLQIGARYDIYRIDSEVGDPKFGPARSRDFNNVSASVGVAIPLTAGASVGGNIARAFRAPTVEELFSNAFHAAVGAYDRGNPDLRSETNLGGEVVLRAQQNRLTGQLSAYLNRIDDYIFPEVVGDIQVEEEDGEAFVVPLNEFTQADASLIGVEGKIEAAVTPQLVLGAMGDAVRGEFVDGGPLPFMPASRLGGSARWDNGRFSVGGELRRAFEQDNVPDNELATDAYTLVNLSIGYTLIRGGQVHTLTLRGDNLFDAEYRDATSRIKAFASNPGRNLSLVYKMLF